MRELLVLILMSMASPTLAGPPQPRITASSQTRSVGQVSGPDLAFDGDLATGWTPAGLSGVGDWIEVEFRRPERISSLTIFAGHFEGARHFRAHNRLIEARILLTTRAGEKVLTASLPDTYAPVRLDIADDVRRLRLEIVRVAAGSLESDTTIAELAFNLDVKDPQVMKELEAWRSGSKGSRALAAERERLELSFQEVRAGKRTSLPGILEAARRDLAPTRARLGSLVPPGFLMTYLEPDRRAVEMLRELELPEAISALEQGLWLMDEVDAGSMRRVITYLEASEALNRPRAGAVPVWGMSGWELGALQSLKEPLALVVDADERVWVADIGNNRVQRFKPGGRFDRSTPGVPTIEEEFLGEQVPHFVAGAAAGVAPGEFTHPLALALAKVGGEVRVAVVDASRRLQVLDEQLKPMRMWSVPAIAPLVRGVGIAGPALVMTSRTVWCLWGREAFVYDQEGALLRRFELAGEARAAVAWKRGVLVHEGGASLHYYGSDGFPFGPVITLEEGALSEELDLTLGPRGRLYVHTDHGRLLRFNRRGRLELEQKTLERVPLGMRIAVGQTQIYLSSGDRIQRVPLR